MKELIINGTVYAKYEIDNNNLFFKMINQIVKGKRNERQSEDLLIHIIQLVENTKFYWVGYLNI